MSKITSAKSQYCKIDGPMGIWTLFCVFQFSIFPFNWTRKDRELRDKLEEVWMRKKKKSKQFYFVFHKVAKVDHE